MSEAVETTAPAQPETPPDLAPVTTAAEKAVADGNYDAFRAAKLAERQGKPLDPPAPAPEATPAEAAAPGPAPAPAPERKVSKRQETINNYERQIAELNERLRAFEARVPPPAPAPEPTKPTDTFPDYATYLQSHPNTSLETYIDARQDWRNEQAAAKAQRESFERQQTQTQEQIVSAAAKRYAEAVKANPDFEASLDPAILAIPTREKAIADRMPLKPEHDFASELLKSEVLPQLLAHLSANPDAMEKVRACQTRSETLRLFGRLEAKFLDAPPAPAPPPAKTLTAAPEPPTALGSRPAPAADPIEHAVVSNNYEAFKAARMQQRLAQVRK